jgi:hypothetical protein
MDGRVDGDRDGSAFRLTRNDQNCADALDIDGTFNVPHPAPS